MGSNAANTDIFFATTTPAIVANGAPNHSNSYLLDGISLDDSPSGGDAKLVPNKESIGEVIVSTSNYSAEFGKAAGLVTQITSKSGANKFHGSGFEQYQNSKLDARTYFQNFKDPLNGYITPYHRNEFGGSFGGPIRKDRTFFFGSYDQVISSTSNEGQVQVEDPAFTAYVKANYPNNLSTQLLTQYPSQVNAQNNFVIDVGTATRNALGAGPYIGDCIAKDDPSGVNTYGFPCGLAAIDNVNATTVAIHNGYQFNGRIDQAFSNSKDRVYANMYKTHLLGPNNLGPRAAFDNNFPQDAWFRAVNYIHVFSPNILSQSSFGYTRTSVLIPCNHCDLLPVGIGGNGFTGFGDGFSPTSFAQNDFHWREMLSLTRGKHSIKTGFEWFHNQDYAPFTVNDSRGQGWGFDNIFDFATDKVDEYGNISFDPKTGGVANNNRYFLDSTYGAYIQDDWKTTKDLTLNFGLRWDATSNPSEARGTLSTLTLGTGATLLDKISGASVGLNPDPAKRRPFIDHKKTYFAPRFGFAYRPLGLKDWSVRGGAGIFFDRGGNTNWSDTETGNPPAAANFTASVHNASGPQPPAFQLCASATYPYNCPLPPGLLATLPPVNVRGGFGNFNSIGGPDPHLKMAYLENFFFGVQHSFAGTWIAEADFIHASSIHEYSITNVNRADGINNIFVNASGQIQQQLGALPNPYFANINYADNRAGSSYNGFTTYVSKTFKDGLSFRVSFTTQKTIDLMSTAPGAQKGAEYSVVIDAYNIAAQRGLSSQDTPKQLSYNGLYRVPTPHFDNHFAREAAGGWQVSFLGTLMSGFPATVFTTNNLYDFNLDGQNYDLPNKPVFGATLKGISRNKYLSGAFKTTDFPLPLKADGTPTGQEGTLGRNTFRGPGFAQTDGAVAKAFKLPFFFGERADTEVRLDVYNLFNRVNLQGWDTNLADGFVNSDGTPGGNFGKTLGTAQARTLQLGAKFNF